VLFVIHRNLVRGHVQDDGHQAQKLRCHMAIHIAATLIYEGDETQHDAGFPQLCRHLVPDALRGRHYK